MKIRRSEFVLLLQAGAIMLPVVALSVFALRSLHEDKTAIEKQAKDRAQAELPEVRRAFGNMILALPGRRLGEIKEGQAVAAPDYPQQPEPDRTHVSAPALARLKFLEMAERGNANNLIDLAVDTAHQFPEQMTVSGTPVAGLALLIALRHVKSGTPPHALLVELHRNVTEFPSFLAPQLLRMAKHSATDVSGAVSVEATAKEWANQEASRESTRAVMRSVAGHLVGAASPTLVRISSGGENLLASCIPSPKGWKVTYAPDTVESLLATIRKSLPDRYSGLTVQMDQERWHSGSVDSSPVLASTSEMVALTGAQRSSISIDLADPELLYASYRQRANLTQWLIVSAAVTATIGLASLWMGYRRQARLSEMKSNFVSSVSHELRAPLAAVRLMAESLESGRIADEAGKRNYYHLIVEECRRLSSLVENVLDLSRMGAGRKRYTFEAVDLTALLRQSVALMEPCAAERQITLRLVDEGAGELQPAWDGEAVEQSLVNLLDNAIKHSPAGAEVRVAVERDNGNVRLWVEDRGPGIPAREQKRIFELFHRHGSELRRETRGVGIGLNIVRNVAEAHGGRVIVDSEVGRGSRFGLELPVEHRT